MPISGKQSASKKPTRAYWDSCVFISYIEADQARIADIDALFEEARKGSLEIVTSVATITEVAFIESERYGQALDRSVEQEIDKLWTPPSPVKLVEFHQLIATDARDLQRLAMTKGWSLKPYDAIHLATARWINADRFDTYDDKLPRYSADIRLTVGKPLASQMTFGLDSP
jgi:predicted nucleic acid-binding protein